MGAYPASLPGTPNRLSLQGREVLLRKLLRKLREYSRFVIVHISCTCGLVGIAVVVQHRCNPESWSIRISDEIIVHLTIVTRPVSCDSIQRCHYWSLRLYSHCGWASNLSAESWAAIRKHIVMNFSVCPYCVFIVHNTYRELKSIVIFLCIMDMYVNPSLPLHLILWFLAALEVDVTYKQVVMRISRI